MVDVVDDKDYVLVRVKRTCREWCFDSSGSAAEWKRIVNSLVDAQKDQTFSILLSYAVGSYLRKHEKIASFNEVFCPIFNIHGNDDVIDYVFQVMKSIQQNPLERVHEKDDSTWYGKTFKNQNNGFFCVDGAFKFDFKGAIDRCRGDVDPAEGLPYYANYLTEEFGKKDDFCAIFLHSDRDAEQLSFSYTHESFLRNGIDLRRRVIDIDCSNMFYVSNWRIRKALKNIPCNYGIIGDEIISVANNINGFYVGGQRFGGSYGFCDIDRRKNKIADMALSGADALFHIGVNIDLQALKHEIISHICVDIEDQNKFIQTAKCYDINTNYERHGYEYNATNTMSVKRIMKWGNYAKEYSNRNRGWYVYILMHSSEGIFKIGRTDNLYERVNKHRKNYGIDLKESVFFVLDDETKMKELELKAKNNAKDDKVIPSECYKTGDFKYIEGYTEFFDVNSYESVIKCVEEHYTSAT